MSDVIVIGVAGGTGSGKTTLVKALAPTCGLWRWPDGGTSRSAGGIDSSSTSI